jgi:telomerase reverse transcriptase
LPQTGSKNVATAPGGNSVQASAKKHKKSGKNQRKSEAPAMVSELREFTSLTELATPIARVSAFCQAVFKKVLPDGFWGQGEIQTTNKDVFLKNVDHFVHLRRFELLNLHELSQGLKVKLDQEADSGLIS